MSLLRPSAMESSSPLSSVDCSKFSSPLSSLSKTPSLPNSPTLPQDAAKRYPSPSSTASGTQSPTKMGDGIFEAEMREKLNTLTEDGPPPAKKRRIAPPKERTTEYLDLTKPDEEFNAEDNRQMERLLTALRKKKKVVVIAGAGISVSAGIPDFRSSNGLFASAKSQHKLKGSGKHLFDASVYKHDSSTQSFHTMVREMSQMTQKARPTPFHHLLASLAQEGRLLRLYSQNIDCLDTSMKPLATNVPLNPKGPWPATIQLHGGLEKMVCTKCGKLEPFNGDVFDGPEAPLCPTCQVDDEVRTAHAGKRSHGIGRLRPRFVLYNEYNPDEEAIGNVSSADLKSRPDCVIVVGTTLKVPGTRRLVKEMCQVTRGRKNGLAVWVNVDNEPKGVDFKDCWDIVVKSKCDNVARLAALPPWDCSIGDEYLVSQEEDRDSQERRSKTTFSVSISSSPVDAEIETQLTVKPKHVEEMQGIPTPTASPRLSAAEKAAKLKQIKISFSGSQPDFGKAGKVGKVGKAEKAPKSRRKPKQQPTKAKPAKNSVTNTFKAVKHNKVRSESKISVDIPFKEFPPMKEEDFSPNSPFSLRPKGLSCRKNFTYTYESELDGQKAKGPSLLSTPERRPHRETISPPSIPRNMQGLIDM